MLCIIIRAKQLHSMFICTNTCIKLQLYCVLHPLYHLCPFSLYTAIISNGSYNETSSGEVYLLVTFLESLCQTIKV